MYLHYNFNKINIRTNMTKSLSPFLSLSLSLSHLISSGPFPPSGSPSRMNNLDWLLLCCKKPFSARKKSRAKKKPDFF